MAWLFFAIALTGHHQASCKYRHETATTEEVAEAVGHEGDRDGQDQQLLANAHQRCHQQSRPQADAAPGQDSGQQVLAQGQALGAEVGEVAGMQVVMNPMAIRLAQASHKAKAENCGGSS